MYNKVILVGNLTRDIELRYVGSGTAIAKTAIATNRKFKKQDGSQADDTCFIDITLFGRAAEIANQYLKRGSKVLIEGRLSFEQWTDQSGGKRSKHSVAVESMQMLDSRGSSDNSYDDFQSGENYGGNENYGSGRENFSRNERKENPFSGSGMQNNSKQENNIPEIDIDDDEIPF